MGGTSALGGSTLPPGASADDETKLSKGQLKKLKAKEKAEREKVEAEAVEETKRALAAAGIDVPAGGKGGAPAAGEPVTLHLSREPGLSAGVRAALRGAPLRIADAFIHIEPFTPPASGTP